LGFISAGHSSKIGKTSTVCIGIPARRRSILQVLPRATATSGATWGATSGATSGDRYLGYYLGRHLGQYLVYYLGRYLERYLGITSSASSAILCIWSGLQPVSHSRLKRHVAQCSLPCNADLRCLFTTRIGSRNECLKTPLDLLCPTLDASSGATSTETRAKHYEKRSVLSLGLGIGVYQYLAFQQNVWHWYFG
jgi:hypothetical protein